MKGKNVRIFLDLSTKTLRKKKGWNLPRENWTKLTKKLAEAPWSWPALLWLDPSTQGPLSQDYRLPGPSAPGLILTGSGPLGPRSCHCGLQVCVPSIYCLRPQSSY